jgi:hypothetical protein
MLIAVQPENLTALHGASDVGLRRWSGAGYGEKVAVVIGAAAAAGLLLLGWFRPDVARSAAAPLLVTVAGCHVYLLTTYLERARDADGRRRRRRP